ncbi:hypothetical protein [Arthrobacter luteolus]|uniref:hypothetical protein n=1 Tax=Arthrobacter luteolus TaxID=98672 RepID=UPI00082BFC61|nr:hypothetical protein [Arthrobacter luteolus]
MSKMKPGSLRATRSGSYENHIWRRQVCAWLEFHGIDPKRVLADDRVLVTGNRIIVPVVIEKQSHKGGKRIVVQDDTLQRKVQTVRLRRNLRGFQE